MKTQLLVPVCLFFTVTALQASPVWTSNRDEEYLLSSDRDLSRVSVGLTVERNNRDMAFVPHPAVGEMIDTFQFQRYSGYLGFDVFSWLTIYGTGGGCRVAVGEDQDLKEFGSGSSEYGAGMRLNILDHIILDPLVIEDRIRLTATVQYTRSSFEIAGLSEPIDWFERRSALQLSIVNDIPGNPLFRPEAIALNIGLVYSNVSGNYDLHEIDSGWMTAGVEVFYSKRISFDGNIYFSNNNETRGMNAGLHFRF